MRADPEAAQLGVRLEEPFFARPTRQVARELIGCTLLHDGVGGTIVEAEAYEAHEPACHAYVGLTKRTAVLFGPPGRAYVYICYGIHRMFNVVTEADGTAGAVLIRALEPTHGIEAMRERRGGLAAARPLSERDLCSGPGKLCEALAIVEGQTHEDLATGPIAVHARPESSPRPTVVAGPRIGITKAADLPWRYCDADSGLLSRPIAAGAGLG